MLKRQLVLGIAQATQPGSGQPSIHAAGSGTHRPRFLSSAHTHPPPPTWLSGLPAHALLLTEWVLTSSVKRKCSDSLSGQGPLNWASRGVCVCVCVWPQLNPTRSTACAREVDVSAGRGCLAQEPRDAWRAASSTRHGRSS